MFLTRLVLKGVRIDGIEAQPTAARFLLESPVVLDEVPGKMRRHARRNATQLLHHRAVFESVYLADYSYTSRCYEQIPLSHTLLTKGLIEPIDTRFNSVFHESMRVHYPYLLNKQLPAYDLLASCAVQTQFANNFFLHFAYDRDFARYLPPQVIAQ